MVKVSIEGAGPRIVSIVEPPPQPIELIEQANGQRVSPATISALAYGAVNPAGDGEAAELLRSLWANAGVDRGAEGRWDGWQVATWIATNDRANAARLAGSIDLKTATSSAMVHASNVEACLRWEIATRHCRCGAASDGGYCSCLDDAFARLNVALRAGELVEIGSQFMGPINCDNARGMLFASRAVLDRFPRLVEASRGAPGSATDEAMSELVERFDITSSTRLDKEQRREFGGGAWSREAVRTWWKERSPENAKPGPKLRR